MTQHTPASLADVLERDYFPMPDGKNLYLNEYEWRMVVEALRCYEADQRDAARYRWLRDTDTAVVAWLDEDGPHWSITGRNGHNITRDKLDAAIDAAMSARNDTDQRSMPATGGEKSLNGQVESPRASNLPPSAGSIRQLTASSKEELKAARDYVNIWNSFSGDVQP